MIVPLLLAVASLAAEPARNAPCLPLATTASAIAAHAALRGALGEPMPAATSMVMLYAKGGHLATSEYSVVLVRTGATWRGTAVGRSRIWVDGAPYSPMKRVEWVLDKDTGRRLDDALTRRCRPDRSAADTARAGPPPIGGVPQQVDVVMPGRAPFAFYSNEEDGIADLIRPPQ